jgi:SnoaL-like domain
MKRHRRTWITIIGGLGLCAVLLVGASSAYRLQAAHAAANPSSSPQDGQPDQAVVEHYFQILNAGMISGDFSALADVYWPDATLTQSTPKGVTTVYSGIDAIIAWYAAFAAAHPGMQFIQDTAHPRRNLAPHVVLTYEYAAPVGFTHPGHCMHVFAIQGGYIATLDWTTFYGGAP